MDQIKFMDLGPGGRDSALNATDPGVREGCVSGWLAETWTKNGPLSATQKCLSSLGFK